MNRTNRMVVAATLAVAGVLCLWKAWARVYEPSHEFLGLHTDATVNWGGLPMGWVLFGVALLGGAALVALGGRGE